MKGEWVRLPGSKREYQNTRTKQVLSRRQYDKLPAVERPRSTGHQPFARTLKKRRQDARYQANVRDYILEQARLGNTLTPKQVRQSATFKALIKGFDAKNKSGTPNKNEIKRVLIALGRRRGLPWSVAPGDSAKDYVRNKDGTWSRK